MTLTNSHPIILAFAAQLFALTACTVDPSPEELLRDSVVADDQASLETALRALSSEDIVFAYDERSSTVEIVVELEQIAQLARDFQPDGHCRGRNQRRSASR